MHLSDTSSLAEHLKNIHTQQQNFWKFLLKTTIKNYRFSRHYILEIYKPNLIELILKPMMIYLNAFSYWRY